MATKPITVWVLPPGPNPWKVVFLLEELGVPYEIKAVKFEEVKSPPLTDVNPNGRVPVIQDPNTDLTLWESGAIIQYLIEQYDKETRLSYDSFKEKNLCNQWLMFQVSGQGPYYGQCTWFNYLHQEKLPSAIERYANEIKRVLGVLEGVLSKSAPEQGQQWLVGGRMTFADMTFVPWNERVHEALKVAEEQRFEGFPCVAAWHARMTARESWKKAMALRQKLMEEQGFVLPS